MDCSICFKANRWALGNDSWNKSSQKIGYISSSSQRNETSKAPNRTMPVAEADIAE
jgi:hypothetical protein